MRRLRVGLGQINPTIGDFEGNVRMIAAGIERARALGCSLVAFPELAISAYPPEDLLFKPAFIEANLRALEDVTRASRGLTVVVGFVDRRDDIFNAAAVLHDGARAGVYHKQYLPNYGVFDENRYFQAGREAPVFTAGDTTFAVNICEDIWYPAGPATRQALAGAELIVTINASPYHAGKAHFRQKMLATRAADDLVCLAFVNMVGGQDELGERDESAAERPRPLDPLEDQADVAVEVADRRVDLREPHAEAPHATIVRCKIRGPCQRKSRGCRPRSPPARALSGARRAAGWP